MDSLLFERLRDAAAQVFEGSAVIFAYLFGSARTGRTHPTSDLDIGVYVEPTVASDSFLALSLQLAQRFSDASGVGDTDILILNQAPLPILGRVIRERVVLYSRNEPTRIRFESRTLREFFDFDFHARQLDQ